jgi:hypothetical protein
MLIFPFGRNLLGNSGFDLHAYSGGTLVDAGEIAAGYNSLDRWRVSSSNTAGTRRVDRLSTLNHPNKRTKFNTRFEATMTANSSWDVQQRIESLRSIEAAAAGSISLRIPYQTTNFQQMRIRLAYANSIDNFAGTTQFYDESFAIDPNSLWVDGNGDDHSVIIEDAAIPALAEQGIQLTITFFDPLAVTGVHSFNLSQTMLNIGPEIMPFEYMYLTPDFEELGMQRYFRKSYSRGTTPGQIDLKGQINGMSFATNLNQGFNWGNPMRVIPTVIVYDPQAVTPLNNVRIRFAGSLAVSVGEVNENGFGYLNHAGGAVQVFYHYTAQAEL